MRDLNTSHPCKFFATQFWNSLRNNHSASVWFICICGDWIVQNVQSKIFIVDSFTIIWNTIIWFLLMFSKLRYWCFQKVANKNSWFLSFLIFVFHVYCLCKFHVSMFLHMTKYFGILCFVFWLSGQEFIGINCC